MQASVFLNRWAQNVSMRCERTLIFCGPCACIAKTYFVLIPVYPHAYDQEFSIVPLALPPPAVAAKIMINLFSVAAAWSDFQPCAGHLAHPFQSYNDVPPKLFKPIQTVTMVVCGHFFIPERLAYSNPRRRDASNTPHADNCTPERFFIGFGLDGATHILFEIKNQTEY
mmetsp:Transcript_36343/g.42162  ORF Transcript_36343/g.42162 Transcript_36343/m.42162 type:complete len:169 (+) Transcript_36343:389-895(+)